MQLDFQLVEAIKQHFDKVTSDKPDQVLYHNEHGTYLERWKFQKADGSGYYAHLMHRSDIDLELHDHPFDNATILLEGEWIEHLPNGEARHVGPGYFTMRRAEESHRIELVKGPTKSLFFRGPKIREWGFYGVNGWIHNQDFFRQRGYF